MRIKLSLLSIEETESTLRFIIKPDPSVTEMNYSEIIQGISFIQGNSKNKIILNTHVSFEQKNIICAVPYQELRKVPDNSILMLAILIDNSTKLLKLSYELDKFFTLKLEKDYLHLQPGKDNNITAFIKTNEFISIINNIDKNSEYVQLTGSIFSKFYDIRLIKNLTFFVEHTSTNEKIFLSEGLLENNDHSLNWRLRLNAQELSLYNGNWTLYIQVTIDSEDHILKSQYDEVQFQEFKTYFNVLGELYFISISNDNGLVLSSKKNNEILTASKLSNVSIDSNHLVIDGMIQYLLMHSNDDNVQELIFINRETKKSHHISLQLEDNISGIFKITIDLNETNFYEQNGIWDVFYSYSIDGATDLARLSFDDYTDIHENMILFPRIAYNKFSTIKKIRPYLTLDHNLAMYVNDEIFVGDIKKVSYEENTISLHGSIHFNNIDASVHNIYLIEETKDLKIQFNTSVNKISNTHYFTSSYNWSKLNLSNIQELDFSVVFQFEIAGVFYEQKLSSNFDDILEKSKAIIYPPLTVTIDQKPMNVRPYYNGRNELKFTLFTGILALCTSINSRGSSLELAIKIENQSNIYINKCELVLTNHTTNSSIVIPSITRDSFVETIHFSITKEYFNSLESEGKWNFELLCYVDNNPVTTEVITNDKNLMSKNSTFKSNAKRIIQNIYFSTFFDKKSKRMLFEIRELKAHENNKEKVRFLFARAIAKLIRKFSRKETWLIGENLGEVAQDNGFAFYEYCYKNNIPEQFYYVSKKYNKNADNLQPYLNKVLKYDSFKHLVMYCLSNYLIVSHGIRDVIPSIVHHKMGSNPKKVIYLQHGIIAMKKLQFNRKSYNGKIKKFVVSSNHEKNILINEMNFNKNQIMVTGLSRFDSLIDNSTNKEKKQILLMPTWRDWLINSNEDFYQSKFYHYYHELLNNSKLHTMLEENNLILKFFPHFEMQKLFKDDFLHLNKNIKLVKIGEETVKDLIQDSSLMITDYSSVVFDFNYLQKPSIFYHFDLDEYITHRDSYVNLKTDLVGDTAYSMSELYTFLEEYINNNFSYKPKYLLNSKKYYAFQDKNNSKRIYNEIKSL